ncbi:hypothetical protein [Polymorphum gilvum]|uniref:Uncharacterized protein n=1 Tax=Polymorphum gilvum (strain LMG 25793 / CGMCC 1.9160 / SL003B-26A1) TaxID=991905 RepID=F2J2L6_POLGS|nr:hypothetical protein [Polymorphum gilvum]ADZ70930.1 hypothetical protein SL003B_2506 [Polymorphum gilvum SL003B-26A1]
MHQASALSGLLLLAATYLLAVVTFILGGAPGTVAVYLGGTYALTALAAFLFSRGVLEFVVGADRNITFFVVLRKLTDPLLALVAPITPGFLLPFAVSLYGAFLFFFLKLFLFGDAYLGVPPLFILLYLFVMSLI